MLRSLVRARVFDEDVGVDANGDDWIIEMDESVTTIKSFPVLLGTLLHDDDEDDEFDLLELCSKFTDISCM